MRAWPLVVLMLGCGAAAPRVDGPRGGSENEPDPEQCTATLRIESLGERAEPGSEVEIPFSRLTAVRHCERSGTEELVTGEERGICAPAAGSGRTVARVSCWWAGETSETVLVRVEETLVVRRVETVDERVHGEPAELGAIGLPEHSRLVPLTEAGVE
jgi:hypothetical protein